MDGFRASRAARVTVCLALAGMLAAGCWDGQPAIEFLAATEVNASSPVRATTDQRLAATRITRIDKAIATAMEYLLQRQSSDGAWRSDVYGPFKDGDALTATVANALLDSRPASTAERQQNAIDRALDYVTSMVTDDGGIRAPPHGLAYPTYTAAGAVNCLSRSAHPRHTAARVAWLAYLRERQLAEPLGWTPEDSEYGGWGYAADLPRKPAPGFPLGNLAEPNLSGTVFALRALRAAGAGADDAAVRKTLSFVQRCQNFFGDDAERDARFDDGGFYFMLADPVRNKAGVAGVDGRGRTRFASYGSATADGLQALMMCGAPSDDPRVLAAWKWIESNFSAVEHPGAYAVDREHARPAVYFYYCNSLAHALAAEANNAVADANRLLWAASMVDALVARQRPDGSWMNTAVDVREDDPLVATSLAVSALACFRTIIVSAGEITNATR